MRLNFHKKRLSIIFALMTTIVTTYASDIDIHKQPQNTNQQTMQDPILAHIFHQADYRHLKNKKYPSQDIASDDSGDS